MKALGIVSRVHRRMGCQANQGEMDVVIDGKHYGITDYVEE